MVPRRGPELEYSAVHFKVGGSRKKFAGIVGVSTVSLHEIVFVTVMAVDNKRLFIFVTVLIIVNDFTVIRDMFD